jgi:predicted outer membrane repeat protein
MSDEVIVDDDLSITGNENTYTTLVAADNKRHFKINSGTPTLTLKWLNLTGGDPSTDHGGSIHTTVESHLNITHCIFYKNAPRATFGGGAILASDPNVLISLTSSKFIENHAGGSGGAISTYGTFTSHNVQYLQNSAGSNAGALYLQYIKSGSTISNSLFISNEAKNNGGGIFVIGNTATGSARFSLTGTTFKHNKQTTGTSDENGGGALYIQFLCIVSIRECTFVENEAEHKGQGHQIFTYKKDSLGTPSIKMVNTNFTNIDGAANSTFGRDSDASEPKTTADKYIAPTNCGASPCSVSPFAGTCTARTNTKYGVLCGLSISECSNGEFGNFQEVTESILPPISPSCSLWTSCTAGKYVSTNGTNTTDRVCTTCGSQKYSALTNQISCMDLSNCSSGSYVATPGSPNNDRACTSCESGKFTNASNMNECMNWTECESSEIIIFNGSDTSDRTCSVETSSTTTEAPTTTTSTGKITTTTSVGNATTTTAEAPSTSTTNANITAKGNILSGAVRLKCYWLLPTFMGVAWCFLI